MSDGADETHVFPPISRIVSGSSAAVVSQSRSTPARRQETTLSLQRFCNAPSQESVGAEVAHADCSILQRRRYTSVS